MLEYNLTFHVQKNCWERVGAHQKHVCTHTHTLRDQLVPRGHSVKRNCTRSAAHMDISFQI